jgi:hypothetical protein
LNGVHALDLDVVLLAVLIRLWMTHEKGVCCGLGLVEQRGSRRRFCFEQTGSGVLSSQADEEVQFGPGGSGWRDRR